MKSARQLRFVNSSRERRSLPLPSSFTACMKWSVMALCQFGVCQSSRFTHLPWTPETRQQTSVLLPSILWSTQRDKYAQTFRRIACFRLQPGRWKYQALPRLRGVIYQIMDSTFLSVSIVSLIILIILFWDVTSSLIDVCQRIVARKCRQTNNPKRC